MCPVTSVLMPVWVNELMPYVWVMPVWVNEPMWRRLHVEMTLVARSCSSDHSATPRLDHLGQGFTRVIDTCRSVDSVIFVRSLFGFNEASLTPGTLLTYGNRNIKKWIKLNKTLVFEQPSNRLLNGIVTSPLPAFSFCQLHEDTPILFMGCARSSRAIAWPPVDLQYVFFEWR